MPRSRRRRQAEDRGEGRASALPPGRGAVTAVFTLGRQDARPRPHNPTTPQDRQAHSGRPQDRARLLLPEAVSDRTGLVPGTTVRVDVLATGQLLLTPLPGQDAARLAWQATRLLRLHEAQALQTWAVQMSLAGRVPYADLSPAGRKHRRQVEARTGIPRDWLHGPAGSADYTA